MTVHLGIAPGIAVSCFPGAVSLSVSVGKKGSCHQLVDHPLIIKACVPVTL